MKLIKSSINTENLAPKAKLSAWEDLLRQSYGPLEACPWSDCDFFAKMDSRKRGDIKFHAIHYSNIDIILNEIDAKNETNENFTLSIPTQGQIIINEYKNIYKFKPGNLYLYSQSTPYRAIPKSEYRTVSVTLPIRMLQRRANRLAALYTLPLAAAPTPGGALVTDFARHLAVAAETCSDHEFSVLTEQFADLLALFFLQRVAPDESAESCVRTAHRQRAFRAIETHAQDPSLSPQSLAELCGISVSYLYNIFRSIDRSVEASILEARLKIAQRMLGDPHRHHLRIASIAYDCGFSDPAHFNRAFKRHFGLTPGDARQRAVQAQANPSVR